MPELKDKEIAAAKKAQKPYKLFDTKGLYLLVTPTGGRLWRLRYRIDGKEKLLALGSYPEISLKRARERRDEARTLVAEKIDPSAKRQEDKAATSNTFESVAREWLSLQAKKLTPGSLRRERDRLEDFVFPFVGGRPVSSESDRGGVAEKIRQLKTDALIAHPRAGADAGSANVDSPLPFSIHKLWYDLYLLVSATHLQTGNQTVNSVAYRMANGMPLDRGDALRVRPPALLPQDNSATANPKVYLSQSSLNIRRQLEGLAYRLRDGRYDFLFRPGDWLPDLDGNVRSDLDVLLERWVGCADRPITILDLSGVPREVLHVIVGVVLRIVYDALFWARNLSEGGRERPLLVVLEEAHAYLSKEDTGPAVKIVRRIVREGRKYGIGAMVITQRPNELDSTILSQCGTMISLRLTNSLDRGQVTAAAQDNLEGLFSLLPILRTGEAIVVGDAVHIPTRVLIQTPPLDRRPASEDPVVYEPKYPGGWNRTVEEDSDYSKMIESWRQQNVRVTGRD